MLRIFIESYPKRTIYWITVCSITHVACFDELASSSDMEKSLVLQRLLFLLSSELFSSAFASPQPKFFNPN
jgi:hypothetical protein